VCRSLVFQSTKNSHSHRRQSKNKSPSLPPQHTTRQAIVSQHSSRAPTRFRGGAEVHVDNSESNNQRRLVLVVVGNQCFSFFLNKGTSFFLLLKVLVYTGLHQTCHNPFLQIGVPTRQSQRIQTMLRFGDQQVSPSWKNSFHLTTKTRHDWSVWAMPRDFYPIECHMATSSIMNESRRIRRMPKTKQKATRSRLALRSTARWAAGTSKMC
jgi:hypothetical protein